VVDHQSLEWKHLLPFSAMSHGLTDPQIEQSIRELLTRQRRVTVREVMTMLRLRFGSSGRTERICQMLKRLESEGESARAAQTAEAQAFEALNERIRAAEARAALSEERERHHQDLWAERYAEKVAQLDRQQVRAAKAVSGVTPEQYLRVYQRAAELARRLAKYEDPDKPAPEAPGD
jgi:hypothetical protein